MIYGRNQEPQLNFPGKYELVLAWNCERNGGSMLTSNH
jgi:hypothetical protein